MTVNLTTTDEEIAKAIFRKRLATMILSWNEFEIEAAEVIDYADTVMDAVLGIYGELNAPPSRLAFLTGMCYLHRHTLPQIEELLQLDVINHNLIISGRIKLNKAELFMENIITQLDPVITKRVFDLEFDKILFVQPVMEKFEKSMTDSIDLLDEVSVEQLKLLLH